MARVMWIRAALLMLSILIFGSARKPAIGATLTIRPPVKVPGAAPLARASMRLPTSCATKNAPFTLVSKTKSKSLGDTSCTRWVEETPELLTRMSMEPTSVSARATAALIES